jgi:hypothetical protein
MTCKECLYFEPDYGIFTATGWTRDGSNGYCHVEPKRMKVDGKRVKCKYFLPKDGSEVKHDAQSDIGVGDAGELQTM